MPIEFRCPGCSKLLRTPDESAGKKAQCPQCGTITDVPAQSAAWPGESPSGPAPAGWERSDNAFADAAAPSRSSGMDAFNPYASPMPAATLLEAKGAPTPLVHRHISVDEILSRSWAIFQTQLGPCALVGLVFVAITWGVNIATSVARTAVELAGEPALIGIALVAEQVIGFLVNTFFALGLALFSVRLARTGQVQLNDLFGAGPYYLRGLLATFLFQVMMGAVALVCLAPGGLLWLAGQDAAVYAAALIVGGLLAFVLIILIALRFFLINLFIVDQNTGVISAFNASAQFMAGNKLTAFLTGLIVSVIGGVATVCTCLVASVLFIPYASLYIATLYLLATGQPVYTPAVAKPPPPPPTADYAP